MAATTSGGITTITPTPWKWILGAIFFLPFFPLSLVIVPMFLLTATGKTQNIVLTPEGFTVQKHWKKTSYRWDEIGELRLLKMRSNFITVADMIQFVPRDKEHTLLAKATKLLGGGTHSVPVIGMKAKDLVHLMAAYQQGAVPQDTAPSVSTPMPTLARPAMARAPANTPPLQRPAAPVRKSFQPTPSSKSKTGFGKKTSPKIGKVPLQQNPLVQDSSWRKRKVNAAPFG